MLDRLIMITGATGNRGRDVIGSLLDRVPAERVAAAPRASPRPPPTWP